MATEIKKQRRTVRVSDLVPRGRKGAGGRLIVWGYTLADIAHASGLTVRGVRDAIRCKRLVPGDLRSLAEWLTTNRRSRATRIQGQP
jgi:hypothetical protein